MPSNLDNIDDPWSDVEEDHDPFCNGLDPHGGFEQPPGDDEAPPAEVVEGNTTMNAVQQPAGESTPGKTVLQEWLECHTGDRFVAAKAAKRVTKAPNSKARNQVGSSRPETWAWGTTETGDPAR